MELLDAIYDSARSGEPVQLGTARERRCAGRQAAAAADQRWRRARWATRVQFAALGLFAGFWGAHIPSVKLQSRAERSHAVDWCC